MIDLNFEKIQEGRQKDHIKKVAPTLWQHAEVAAIWIVGSLVRGEADHYSDADLWIAVSPNSLEKWKSPDLAELFDHETVGYRFLRVSDHAFLHGVLLSDGTPFDLCIQGTEEEPPQEPMLVLGCRDEEFEQRLKSSCRERSEPAQVTQEFVERVVINYWINTLKHEKVIHRDLELLSVVGLHIERMVLMQLWYILDTGYDPSYFMGTTAHGLIEQARSIQRIRPDKGQSLIVGDALTDRSSIYRAIEDIRDEVSRIGRTLSERLGFEYPAALEETIRESWRKFKESYGV